ncbi:MAG: sigma 54-interacting transcriptional regulator [Flavobacteriaceae bacterium]|nr:sigma 54-interacting transcriptional regulator [Flavobacteriaceae bacterium]
MKKSTTLGALKKSNYKPLSIQQELAQNVRARMQNGQPTFEGLLGYENTVIPDVERALLSGHSINLLGLRGQAKTRLARQLTQLLDEWVPVVEDSEINDDPLDPVSNFAKERIAEKGDDTPITWLHRDDRFFEKLATPDVSVADLIGDVDPIKAANLKLSYANERVIHFGMIPRAHRCIFVLNELPDLQARIQVALFSILQEKEIQIRGFKLRLPIETQFIFTANPEDYTNRGSIVTPLKDRIGSQILTHYPHNLETAKAITRQETQANKAVQQAIHVPELARDILEQIGFEARKSEYVDSKSGVSARMSITAFENLMSAAERRMLMSGEQNTSIRMSDFLGIIPAINGKVELVYKGEQEGAEQISFHLINQAVKTLFPTYFPDIKKLEKQDEEGPYDLLLGWFYGDNELFLEDNLPESVYQDTLMNVPNLKKLIATHQADCPTEDLFFMMEFLLWGLEANKKLNKYRTMEGFQFKDGLGNLLSGI